MFRDRMFFRFPQPVRDAEGGAGGGAGGGGGDQGAGSGGGSGGGEGAPGAHWSAPLGLSAEQTGYLQTKGYKGLGPTIDGLMNLEKVVGLDKLALPPKDKDGKRSWDGWDGFSELGRPESPDKYSVKTPDGYQLTDHDKAFHAAIRPAAHKAGLAQWQVDIMADAFNGFTGGLATQKEDGAKAEAAASEQALRKELGGEYDKAMALANRAVSRVGGADLVASLDKSGFGRDPAMVKAWIAVGRLLGEDSKLPGGEGGGGGVLNPAGAKAEVERMENEALQANIGGKSHPGWDKAHPEYRAWQDKRQDLIRLGAQK